MDYMGHRDLVVAGRVHPLTILDDHSRVLLSLTACPHERLEPVWLLLHACFARYGLPRALLTDNGPPWGSSVGRGITRIEARLLRLGIELWHGRPFHPQTQGKVERIHGTISVDVFGTRTFRDLVAAQRAFDTFRDIYNLERPLEALDYAVPMSRMQPSPRPLPTVLPVPKPNTGRTTPVSWISRCPSSPGVRLYPPRIVLVGLTRPSLLKSIPQSFLGMTTP